VGGCHENRNVKMMTFVLYDIADRRMMMVVQESENVVAA
jgi:hypothetical protein